VGWQASKSKNSGDGYGGCATVILILIVGLIWLGPMFMGAAVGGQGSSEAACLVATVTKTERVMDAGGKSSRYLIYTDQEVIEDTDNWIAGKTNSSDIYGKIVAGRKYRFTLIGWRNEILSHYRNITKVEEMKP
jgi:hypothetical protein